MVARRQSQLEKLAAELSNKYSISTTVIVKDLSLPASAAEIFNELKEKSIHIDILVNNAGFQIYGEFHKTNLEGTGITVTTLCPGATRTEFAEKAQIQNTRLFSSMVMKPDTVAKIGYRALMKGKRVVAGLYNKSMVFSLRFTPKWLVLKIGKILMSSKPVTIS